MGEDSEDFDSRWAHVLWQRRGLRMEEFMAMSMELKCVYVASELVADREPVNTTDALVRSLSKIKAKKH